MPAIVSADFSRLDKGARLHAGKVFRRKDLAGSLPSVDREQGRSLKAGLVRRVAQGLYTCRGTLLSEKPRPAKKTWSAAFWTTITSCSSIPAFTTALA